MPIAVLCPNCNARINAPDRRNELFQLDNESVGWMAHCRSKLC